MTDALGSFDGIAAAAPFLIWVSGPDGARVFFNEPWRELTGRALEELRGAGWAAVVHPDDRGWVLDAYAAAATSREPLRLEYRLQRPDGQHRWMLDVSGPRVTPDGSVRGRVGACVDVTEHRETQARLSWLIEHASDIVSVVGQDGVIRFESPSVERLLGWRPEELVGRRLLDYVHPDDAAHVVDAIARRIADPTPVNPPTEFRVRARDGSWHLLAAMSRVVSEGAGAGALIVNSRDVTEQRALEASRRHAQRTEVIAQLAAAAAHEINNPLTVLLAHL